jgi:DNA repair protein RadC
MIVDTASRAAELLAPYLDSEGVAVLHLDSDRRLIAATVGKAAGEDDLELPVRDIIGAALRLGAAAIIVAHARSGGDAEPSEDDLQASRRLAQAAAAAGLSLLDHLVFAGGDCRSLGELGLLKLVSDTN